jgi:hypothetical protein
VELVFFLQWVQTNVPDVYLKKNTDMKIIPVVVDITTKSFFIIDKDMFSGLFGKYM